MFISIVVPFYNEADNIKKLYECLKNVMDSINERWELICIDDGSTDDTLKELLTLHKQDNRIKIISFSRNFGQGIALTAGLDHANGDVVIPMDADLQNPPEVIIDLIAKYHEGYDVVNAVRTVREGEPFFKKFTSKVFYKIINKISKVEIPPDVAEFRLISSNVLNELKNIREKRRFMKGIFAWVGFKTAQVYYEAKPRYAGKTKWNYLKRLDLAIEGITSFSIAPLRVASVVGILVSCFSFIYALYIAINTIIFGNPVKGYSSGMVTILFIGGVQLIVLGVIGEYLGRIYEESKQRPIYIIREKIGFVDKNDTNT